MAVQNGRSRLDPRGVQGQRSDNALQEIPSVTGLGGFDQISIGHLRLDLPQWAKSLRCRFASRGQCRVIQGSPVVKSSSCTVLYCIVLYFIRVPNRTGHRKAVLLIFFMKYWMQGPSRPVRTFLFILYYHRIKSC